MADEELTAIMEERKQMSEKSLERVMRLCQKVKRQKLFEEPKARPKAKSAAHKAQKWITLPPILPIALRLKGHPSLSCTSPCRPWIGLPHLGLLPLPVLFRSSYHQLLEYHTPNNTFRLLLAKKSMNIKVEIKHETIVACAIIIFLIADLYSVGIIVQSLVLQVSNTQYITTAMTARNQTTAPTYMAEGIQNQYVDTIIGALVLFFLAYMAREFY